MVVGWPNAMQPNAGKQSPPPRLPAPPRSSPQICIDNYMQPTGPRHLPDATHSSGEMLPAPIIIFS